MADIINLRQERKRRERRRQEREAAENRSRFGLTRAERTSLKDERERQRTKLDGHKLDEDR